MDYSPDDVMCMFHRDQAAVMRSQAVDSGWYTLVHTDSVHEIFNRMAAGETVAATTSTNTTDNTDNSNTDPVWTTWWFWVVLAVGIALCIIAGLWWWHKRRH